MMEFKQVTAKLPWSVYLRVYRHVELINKHMRPYPRVTVASLVREIVTQQMAEIERVRCTYERDSDYFEAAKRADPSAYGGDYDTDGFSVGDKGTEGGTP